MIIFRFFPPHAIALEKNMREKREKREKVRAVE
jgi:hypothetical protein